jgi:S-adenosylmethionine hydrolase
VSDTFHGRDIFSPAAAHLSLGRNLPDMGSPIKDPVRLDRPCPVRDGDLLRGEIARVDHFGNLITNIHETDVTSFLQGGTPQIRIQDLALQDLHRYYESVPKGKPLALLGSSHRLEIAVNQGSAARLLGKKPEDLVGQSVEIRRVGDDDSPDPYSNVQS